MTQKNENWYRRELPEKQKKLLQAEREFKVAELALNKAQAELAYRKAELEHYQVMADLTDEEMRQWEEQRKAWSLENKTVLKEVA